jgi:hypothetical protein
MDNELNAMTPDDEALLRRCKELTRDFKERHPAKSRAADFVNGLIEKARLQEEVRIKRGAFESRADRERERARNELFVRYDNFSDLFKSAEPDLEEFVFDLLLKIMQACHDLGMLSAPDGRAARSARSARSGSRFVNLITTVAIYCREHGLEPHASEKFANIIRPDILELFGKPKDAPSKIPPSLSAIVKALRSVRKGSFVL